LPALQNSFLHSSFLFRCIVAKNHYTKERDAPCIRHGRAPDHKSPSLERRPMADTDSSSAQKNHAHAYNLLAQLNEAFVRVQRRIALLQQVGIFDPLMMQMI